MTQLLFIFFLERTMHLQSKSRRSDWDEDCEEGLVCWYEDGSGEVPGCSGTPRAGWEYCIDPKASDGVETDSITANQSNYTGLSLTEADYISKCEGDW